ncbi:MAG: 50S ribosomal protein L20 [Chitinophagia bacterium]|nr:50S ribosomal protein L20 [Chitinophagia bacterium]
MPRSVNAVASRARRKKILKQAKGFYGKRKNVYTVAKNVLEKGLGYKYVGRKLKKREYRSLWIVRINAALRPLEMNYSTFIGKINAYGIDLNRKVLADLAMNEPETFTQLVHEVKARMANDKMPAKKELQAV